MLNTNPTEKIGIQTWTLLDEALKYLEKGNSVIPTDSSKRPLTKWKKYCQELPDQKTVREFFKSADVFGIGIVCGYVSGGLEVIDIDLKYDISGNLFERIGYAIEKALPGSYSKLHVVKTRSGGYHLYYRCESIEGNQKLAQRYTTNEELQNNPKEKIKVLIETRGISGYVIAPPSPGYSVIQQNDIPIIGVDERESLLCIFRSFNEVTPKVQSTPHEEIDNGIYSTTPWNDYDSRGDVEHLLESHGWSFVYEDRVRRHYRRPGKSEGVSGNFNSQLNLWKVFSTSTNFVAERGYSRSAVFALLECEGDFGKSCRALEAAGFGKRVAGTERKFAKEILKLKKEGLSKDAIIRSISYHNKISEAQATAEVVINEKYLGDTVLKFWDLDDKDKLRINRTKLQSFLEENGFYQYCYDSKGIQLIRVQDNIIEEVTTEQIKKFVKEYIYQLPGHFDNGNTPSDLMELILRGSDAYFNKGSLEFLGRFNPDLLKDTPDKAYFPFRNGIIEVTKQGSILKTYDEIQKHIWKSQVKIFDIDIFGNTEIDNTEYFRFLSCISDNDKQRLTYAITIIGYLLHKYKNPAKPFAIILGEETDNENLGGGTGKGIFVKALQFMINVVRVDGKNFKLDKGFPFQRVGLDTNLIAIEDCRKDVDFEGYYSIITEGITIEKKNKDEIRVPFEESPKALFSTNFSISNVGHHAQRRQKLLEFAPFFNPKYTPEDFFGHQLFVDWDTEGWNRFYNLMFYCTQLFLKDGVVEVENSERSKHKQIKISYTPEFFDWFMDHLCVNKSNWKLFFDLYSDFLRTNDIESKDFSSRRFKKALEDSSQILGLKLERRVSRRNGNKAEHRLVKSPTDHVRSGPITKTDFTNTVGDGEDLYKNIWGGQKGESQNGVSV